MKKPFLFLIIFFLGCNGGNGDRIKSAQVIGDIYNNKTPTITMKQIIAVDPERLQDVSIGKPINIDISIFNDGNVDLSEITYEIMIEDESYFTSEAWTCLRCFPNITGGSFCDGIWEIFGGTLIDPQPSPALPICEGADPAFGYCYDNFPINIDCDNPYWAIEYREPGNGLWKLKGSINSLPVNESFFNSIGFSDSGMIIRLNHYARWIVRDSDDTVIVQKDYVFNVIQ